MFCIGYTLSWFCYRSDANKFTYNPAKMLRFEMDPTWAETGDRYLLKLFRDYVFHQVRVRPPSTVLPLAFFSSLWCGIVNFSIRSSGFDTSLSAFFLSSGLVQLTYRYVNGMSGWIVSQIPLFFSVAHRCLKAANLWYRWRTSCSASTRYAGGLHMPFLSVHMPFLSVFYCYLLKFDEIKKQIIYLSVSSLLLLIEVWWDKEIHHIVSEMLCFVGLSEHRRL